jgi:predicted RecB family nuclease
MFALDPYAARSCPLKTAHAFSATTTAPPAIATSMAGTEEFVAEVTRQILAGSAAVTDLRELRRAPTEEQEAACLAAMADGAAVILGGLLPRDWENHRRGRAELLVSDGEGGYLPGVIKFQRAVDPRRDDREFVFSEVADLPRRRTTTGWRYRWNWRWTNAIYLAHLWELLAPTGYQSGRAEALVIGTEQLADLGLIACRLDLTEPAVAVLPGEADDVTHVSALQRYHREFAARVELAQAATGTDPVPPDLLKPVVTRECQFCRWWPVCEKLLDPDDLSLRINKASLDRPEITALRSIGITTVADLAATQVDDLLVDYLPQMAYRPGAEDRLRLAHRRSRLLDQGIQLERLTAGPVDVPQAAVEIDIDVETSRTDRVYLWGFWVGGPEDGRYHQFSSFTDLDDAAELALARQAMTWLRQTVSGRQALVFHYSDYEVLRLSRLAGPQAPEIEWALDFAKTGFVDLFGIVRDHFFGANGLGLKAVASAGAGFHWRDEDPGGLNSMSWFETAVGAESATERMMARQRVLRYNEDDVRATARLRQWLRSLR